MPQFGAAIRSNMTVGSTSFYSATRGFITGPVADVGGAGSPVDDAGSGILLGDIPPSFSKVMYVEFYATVVAA